MIENKDTESMLAFQRGDEKAFEELLARYEKPLVNFIYRFTQNLSDAEDVAQEVFLKVYRARETYEPKAKFSTWLYGIAVNASLDFRKKHRHGIAARLFTPLYHDDETGESQPGDFPDPAVLVSEEAAEQRETRERIQSALASLPDNQRFALILKVYEGRSYEEIAHILQCTVPAVESLLFRARQSLKARLRNLR